MPDLRADTPELVEQLRGYLHSLLPTAVINSVETASQLPPLLLLEMKHNVAAFALPNGNWRADFETQYSGFKHLCDRRQHDWEQFDANFVFCLPHPNGEFDAFCSQVETDIYFCRKFVIPLDGDLPNALARLPFLPLDPLQGGLRPDSAQVFLQRHGISALLARYLATPHQRGPAEIVNDCLSGQLGDPIVSPALPRPRRLGTEGSQETVSIKRIEIENFRAYRKTQVFEVASGVTVLYGPNGFGKTSFFDAIDFAVTGGIGRLGTLTDHQFQKAAPHLDSGPTKSVVKLTAVKGSTEMHLQRSVASANYAMFDGDRKDRKTVLAGLTGAGSPGTERIDHLVRLFRATHQFNQEVQELTREFQKDCRLKSDIVSRMLAFEDYANAVSKAGQVHGDLRHRINEIDLTIAEADRQITTDRKEITRLSPPIQIDGNVPAVETAIGSLRERLAAVHIDADAYPVDAAVVRGWRAAVTARHAEHASRLHRLTELSQSMAVLPENRRLLEVRLQALGSKEQEHAAAEARHAEAEVTSQRAEQSLTETTENVRQLVARRQLLESIRSIKPRYVEAISQQRKLAAESDAIAVQLRDLRTQEEKLVVDLQAVEVDFNGRMTAASSFRQRITALTSLIERHPRYMEQRQRHQALEGEKRTLDQELANFQRSAQKLTEEQSSFSAEEKRLNAQIEQAGAKQSELKRLLLDLASHIDSGACPVCAADYGVKENLLQRIRSHSNAEVASESQQQLQQVKEKLVTTKQALADLTATKLSAEQKLATFQAETNQIEINLTELRAAIDRSGLAADLPTERFTEEVRRRIDAVSMELSQCETAAVEVQSRVDALRISLDANRQIFRQKQFEGEEKSKTLAGIRAELAGMRSDPRLAQAYLDVEDTQLAAEESLVAEHLAQANQTIKNDAALAAQRKSDLNAARQAVVIMQPEVQKLRSQVAAGKKWITEFEARLAVQNLAPTLSPEGLAEIVNKESRQEAELALLGDTAANLEVVLDAATTAAAVSRINENVRSAEVRKANAVRERGHLTPWASFFNDLRTLLSAQQDTAIATFTREYGPRASVIQRRLRSVYGFDDITLSPDGTYALLDLLVGLLDVGSGPRQFILSTCDDRLFQLARQKFRHLGTRAAFYAFLSCGEDGPRVEPMTST